MKKLYILILLFVFILSEYDAVCGANFVVVSNVDGTPNDGVSLRWAVTQAVLNTGPDTISFNIPGPAPHSIALLSDLPQIIGYDAQGTVIDGSTQPANGYTGISPKIIVDGSGLCNNAFDIEIPDCEVYGLVLTRFMMNGILLTEDFIGSTAADNFIIGAPGKGNVIYNMDTTSSQYTNGISIGGVVYLGIKGGKIQGNKIGTDTSGLLSFPMYQGINIYNAALDTTRNILIGGGGVGEGNLISVQGGNLGSNVYIFGAHTITLKGNIIGADKNGQKIWGNTAVTGIYVYAGADSCTIGGTLLGEGNIIAFVEDTTSHNGGGLEVQAADRCLIRRNSIYCNGNWGSIQMLGGNVCGGCFNSYAPPVITTADTTGASGTSSPNDVIELFYNNTGCTHAAHSCSGETYIATVTADNSGNWAYTGSITGGTTLTATATSLDSSRTSAFADCFTVTVAALPPVASFTSIKTVVCQGDCITFTNQSQNGTFYQWIFYGGFPHATAYKDPSSCISYDTTGAFDVMLIATNNDGVSDTANLHNYITVNLAPPTPGITQSHDTLYCSYDPSYTDYQWYSDTTLIPGATQPYLVISTGGNYNVRVTNENGCKVAAGINSTVGVLEFVVPGDSYTLTPNPVTDKLTITGMGYNNAGNSVITIYNIPGQIIRQEDVNLSNHMLFDLKDLKAGAYFVRIQNEQNTWVGKFVKQ